MSLCRISWPALLSTKITAVAVVASTVAAVIATLIAVAVPFGVVEVVITVASAITDLFSTSVNGGQCYKTFYSHNYVAIVITQSKS